MATCATVCDCNITVNNTGVGCTPLMKVEKRPWVMNEVDSLGALNFIDLTSALDDAYFSGLINNADPLKRLFPLPEVKNVEDIREDAVKFDWQDGTQVHVRDGVRKYTSMFPPDSASPQLTGILEGQRCSKPAKFSVDADGTIWGRISEDGTKLFPIKMDAQSVSPIFIKTNDTEPQMLGWSFNYAPVEKDCKIRGLFKDELTGGIDPLTFDGLEDVFAKVISATTTVLTIQLVNNFGTVLNPETIKNLLGADFALFNVTDASAIGFAGVGGNFAETPAGTYVFTYDTADQPLVAEILRLTPTKAGFDFTGVIATSIVVA